MTRFARAKGSKASNERLPENPTPWNVMKKELINKQVEKEFMKGKKQFDQQRQAKYDDFLKKSETVKSEWCEFKEENDKGKIKEAKKSTKKKKDDENMNEDIEEAINQFCEEDEEAPEMISKFDDIVGILEEKLKTNGSNKKQNKKKQINGIENENKQIIDEKSIVENTITVSKKKKKKRSLENTEISENPVEKSENLHLADSVENNSQKTKKLKKKDKKLNGVQCEKVDNIVSKSVKDENVVIKKKSKKVNDLPVNKNEIQSIEVEVKKKNIELDNSWNDENNSQKTSTKKLKKKDKKTNGVQCEKVEDIVNKSIKDENTVSKKKSKKVNNDKNEIQTEVEVNKKNIDETPFELDNSWNDEPDPQETLNVFCSDTNKKGKKKQKNKTELNQVDEKQKEEETSEGKIEEKSLILSRNAKRNLRKKNKKKQLKLEKKLLTKENDKEKLNKNKETNNNSQSEQTQNNITSKRKSKKENNNPKNKKIKKDNKIENNKEVKPATENSAKNKKVKKDNTIENNKESKQIAAKRKSPISDVEKEHKRRKPDIEKQHVIIDGQEEEVIRYDGFPIKISDANRLHDLRKQLISKGIPRSEITRVLKLERRKAEKNLARDRKKVCFHCRKSGHLLSDCPEVGTETMETCNSGICFKCGSTEHTHFNCKIVKGERFNYASCFICKEQGHIAKQCPDNPKGLYPQGGACKLCGDVTHFKKDCPQNMQEKEDNTITVKTFNSNDLEGLDDDNKPNLVQKSVVRKNKVIKFYV